MFNFPDMRRFLQPTDRKDSEFLQFHGLNRRRHRPRQKPDSQDLQGPAEAFACLLLRNYLELILRVFLW